MERRLWEGMKSIPDWGMVYGSLPKHNSVVDMVWALGIPTATTVTGVPLAGKSEELPIGQPAPDFNLTLFSGETVSLKSFRGNVVIINFWHSMCTHCQREAPVLEAAYEKYRERGLVIIGVNISEDEEHLPATLWREQADLSSRTRYGRDRPAL